mmetsp:Transcript_14779/g.22809  ORF Transcript_14779/g.22809 Transcript_14779/m.22809 type:complete len:174 (-) Transcript_14779:30-551(-)
MVKKCDGGFLTLLLLVTLASVASSFSIVSMVLSWPNKAVEGTPTQSLPSRKTLDLDVPNIRVSRASARGLNSLYSPRDPKVIPKGFIRACGKAGGFAPRPLWDDLTTGVTPWFENKQGCFIYFNCNDAHWWIDSEQGSGMYLAAPNGSLLLPPTDGWMTLTGERAGAPEMSFD